MPNSHEFEQIPGESEGQESLLCCSPGITKSGAQLSDKTTTFVCYMIIYQWLKLYPWLIALWFWAKKKEQMKFSIFSLFPQSIYSFSPEELTVKEIVWISTNILNYLIYGTFLLTFDFPNT